MEISLRSRIDEEKGRRTKAELERKNGGFELTRTPEYRYSAYSAT